MARSVPPLRLDRLATRGFRNLVDVDLAPGPHFNVIHGDNGAGKSNLLEAIHYLGALKSFRGGRTDDLIRIGREEAVLKGRFSGEAASRVLSVKLGRGRSRKLSMDGKRPRSVAAWYGTVPMVLFHPGDLTLASGGAEPRRAFLDRILEQIDPSHGKALSAYNKALRSRNRLLKGESPDRRGIAAYDALLAQHGAVVGRGRMRLVEDLEPRVRHSFADVVGESLPLGLRYRPRVTPEEDAILDALSRAYPKDRARGFTADGPHGDDLELTMNDVPARHYASQGQHRAMVLSLKIAELDVLSHRVGRVPILLLDDVSSELDRKRNRCLFELLARLGGQVFLTTTHPEFILLEGQRVDFRVEAGRVAPDEGVGAGELSGG